MFKFLRARRHIAADNADVTLGNLARVKWRRARLQASAEARWSRALTDTLPPLAIAAPEDGKTLGAG